MAPEEDKFSWERTDEAEMEREGFPSENANQISLCEQAEHGLKAIICQYRIDDGLTGTTIGPF
jgi:hypothetical protein